MSPRRLIVSCLLLCLPTAILVGIGVYYAATSVPKLQRNETRRVSMAYRATAEEMLSSPETATYSGPKRRGWRQSGKIAGHAWGRVEAPGKSLVWCQADDKKYLAKAVDTIEETDFALVFYIGGGFIAAVLVALTAFGAGMLVRLVRERDDFIAATAHDLTTPLAGLRYAIGRDAAESRRLNERMIRLVDNLKDFLRLGGKRRQPEPVAFDLAEACREAYSIFSEDYRDLFDGQDVEIAADGKVRAFADETITVQILWNLFGNDLKYAAPYGPVSVRLSKEEGFVRAEFVDEGQGMTRRQMRRAFNRYYRARTALESGKGGFGIGLCTAREFARAMGGNLTVRQNQPRGCVFTLTLPAAPTLLGAEDMEEGEKSV